MEVNGRFVFQDITLVDYEQLVMETKNKWIDLISTAINLRLGHSVSVADKYATVILNTEGWIRSNDDAEFGEEAVEELFKCYQKPLQATKAFSAGGLTELLDQWNRLVSYTIKYLDPQTTEYQIVWRRIFDSSKSNEWMSILCLVELLFVLPVSNAKVERFFSLMNRVKTDTRSSLKQERLSSVLRICTEGPTTEEFDPLPAMQLWHDGARERRPNQSKRKPYKQRAVKERPKTLMDLETTSESELEGSEADD